MSPWPSVPCTKSAGPRYAIAIGASAPSRDRDVGAIGDLEQSQRVARADGRVRVAEHRRQTDHLELGRCQGVEDGHGIVDAGVGVDQDASRRHVTSRRASDRGRAPASRSRFVIHTGASIGSPLRIACTWSPSSAQMWQVFRFISHRTAREPPGWPSGCASPPSFALRRRGTTTATAPRPAPSPGAARWCGCSHAGRRTARGPCG